MKTEKLDEYAQIIAPWIGNGLWFWGVCIVLALLASLLGRNDLAEAFTQLSFIALGASGLMFFGFRMFRLLFEEREQS